MPLVARRHATSCGSWVLIVEAIAFPSMSCAISRAMYAKASTEACAADMVRATDVPLVASVAFSNSGGNRPSAGYGGAPTPGGRASAEPLEQGADAAKLGRPRHPGVRPSAPEPAAHGRGAGQERRSGARSLRSGLWLG